MAMPDIMNQCRVVVLISGNGSNLQAIIDNAAKDLPIDIVGVISNRSDAYGLERAKQAGIATCVIATEDELIGKIKTYEPNLIILAGYMQILSPPFISHFKERIVNIHPALLPKYKGLHTHERVLAAGDKEHGASIHFVTSELDGGPIIAHTKVPVLPQDDVKTLAARVLVAEHWLYSQVIGWFAQKRLKYEQNIVTVDGKRLPPQGLQLSQPTAQGIVS